ncbi:hypothetical protein D4R42_00745 [bacterium]|nr:MAG: hypothetical protein D4R42_00745 [bacterium]
MENALSKQLNIFRFNNKILGNTMGYRISVGSFAPITMEGVAKRIDEVIGTLKSELTKAGFSPKQDVDTEGNLFKLKLGLGASAKVHYKAVGDDVILTPQMVNYSFGVIWQELRWCCMGGFLFLLAKVIRDRNVKNTIRKLLTVLESTKRSFTTPNFQRL